jgi:NAD(P)-dependent dehydrogenase (short-subunit alcohol dehydrogenase family)
VRARRWTLDTSIDDVRRTFETNVFGVLAVCQAFVPGMQRGDGRVVNVSSGRGPTGRFFSDSREIGW